jgi:hypothetical protein
MEPTEEGTFQIFDEDDKLLGVYEDEEQAKAVLTSHRGKPNLSLYFTKEQIDWNEIDEYGKPHYDPSIVEPETLHDDIETLLEKDTEIPLDLTGPGMAEAREDLEIALKQDDLRAALDTLQRMGYPPEDAVELVTDLRTDQITLQELFSRAALRSLLLSSSEIAIQKVGKELSICSKKYIPSKNKSLLSKFSVSSAPLQSLKSLDSCWNLLSGAEIKVSSSDPDFPLISRLLLSRTSKIRFFHPSALSMTSSLKSSASVSDIVSRFHLPEITSQVYKKVVQLELNL